MYGLKVEMPNGERKEFVRIKGLGTKMSYSEFKRKLTNPNVVKGEYVLSKSYNKFTQFKEAKRRGLCINEIVPITKNLLLNDSKRDWNDEMFNAGDSMNSTPICLRNGIPVKLLSKMRRVAMEDFSKNIKEDMREFTNSELFDLEMVGGDIDAFEFIENEKFHALQE